MPGFFRFADKFKPVYDIVYKVIMTLCKVLLIADILVTTWIVISRYFPHLIEAPIWGEQIVLTLMSYMAVLSAALAIRKGTHIRMTALDRKLPRKLRLSLDILADVAIMGLGVVMLVYGWKQAKAIGRFGVYDSLRWLSRFWMYFPIPLAGGAMIVFELEALYNHIKAFFVTEDDSAGCGLSGAELETAAAEASMDDAQLKEMCKDADSAENKEANER
ncbi:MAG: TRAP transporter small permease [Clostridiales bacterium]|nr:TRAP transporter small permease [Clostridiales bacterium]